MIVCFSQKHTSFDNQSKLICQVPVSFTSSSSPEGKVVDESKSQFVLKRRRPTPTRRKITEILGPAPLPLFCPF